MIIPLIINGVRRCDINLPDGATPAEIDEALTACGVTVVSTAVTRIPGKGIWVHLTPGQLADYYGRLDGNKRLPTVKARVTLCPRRTTRTLSIYFRHRERLLLLSTWAFRGWKPWLAFGRVAPPMPYRRWSVCVLGRVVEVIWRRESNVPLRPTVMTTVFHSDPDGGSDATPD